MDIRSKKKIGLVLSGGGIKAAAFHCGVCLALKEHGLIFPSQRAAQSTEPGPEIKVFVGSSAGAFVAAILTAGYDIESLINAFQVGLGNRPPYTSSDLRYLRPIRYSDIFSINKESLLRFLPETLFSKSLFSGGLEALLKSGFRLNGLFSTHGVEKYL
ncbi:MAG: patatin-like phospholipase family protein, partial [Bdellovibrionaceae bacterium]|nr:patatin-like phospholipase family protein [Pseudobdellovibrionaceae bacterium]